MAELFPIVTKTVTEKNYNDSSDNTVMTVLETDYKLADSDKVWIGSHSITVERGNRYEDGDVEHTVRLHNYSEALIEEAIVDFIRLRVSELSDTSPYTQQRAEQLVERILSVMPASRVMLPGEPAAV